MNTCCSKETQKIADFLKALGEFNRLSLVYRLCDCKVPQNAMCLCECCWLDTPLLHLLLPYSHFILILQECQSGTHCYS